MSEHWARSMDSQLCFPPSAVLCIQGPLFSRFFQPLFLVVYPCMHVLGNCHNTDSSKRVSDWLCGWLCLCVPECAGLCVFGLVSIVALHVLWSLFSFLPLMLFPVVSKLPLIGNPLCPAMFLHCNWVNECLCVLHHIYLFISLPTWLHSTCVLSCNAFRGGRKRKTMKLSRDLSNLVVFTNSVASQECLNEGETWRLWQLIPHTQRCNASLTLRTRSHLQPAFFFRYSKWRFVIQRDQSTVSG